MILFPLIIFLRILSLLQLLLSTLKYSFHISLIEHTWYITLCKSTILFPFLLGAEQSLETALDPYLASAADD